MLRRRVPVGLVAIPVIFLLVSGAARAAETVDTDSLNRQPEVREAFQKFYEMDYGEALPRFEAIQREHPSDPIATAYVLDTVLFSELNRLDLLDTTFYANDGFLTTKRGVVEDPRVRDRIRALGGQAIDQANAELKANPNNVDALFARGWTKSLEAVYSGLVERSFTSGLKQALGARSDCDRVLQLDPRYTDAELVVGVDEYVVGALPLAFKILIGFIGIHGTRGEGLALLHNDAEHGVLTRVEANTAMMLFLRREQRYEEAIQIARAMAREYPHDYLFHLEEANLQKDDGEGAEAIETYERVIELAKQPGYYPNAHVELAYYGLADTLRGRRSYAAAAAAFGEGADQPTTSPELKRRCLLEAGKTYDLMHERSRAVEEYQAVLSAGSDSAQGDLARRYLRSPYTGK
jgi:tetratricopeptide (TPR) repeat protein